MKNDALLNSLYKQIHDVILCRQNPVTGLLPASTAVTSHGNYTDAWVRDNVYSITAVWSLALAYKKSGHQERSDELQQATIKLMRGLLQSMMRQADKVEAFKHTYHPADSLHAKYDTNTGLTVVGDHEWGHLQIDATSIFLLMLAQMTASGLRIVLTLDEVDFVQNLIYYIAGAYRTPDYGIWERGNKINNGNPEINASSVGMAKAALQALDGLNLFGENATPRAIVHTVADAISLARITLGALLPRESLSKEVDSALLSVIGFPAFAVGKPELVTKTRDDILSKLGGNYGCKRFLWDGHQTQLEDESRLHYELSELANFEHIESEWPLFFCYLYLNALFAGNETTAAHYREKIEAIMVDVDGQKLIPELYFLQKEHIDAEKKNPGSQQRSPNENVPLVWAQSLYYTALMVDEELLAADDLDPLQMRKRTTTFHRSQVALVVLAENERVKQKLAKNGVIAEAISEIAPVQVISAPHLIEAYGQVGANKALQLSGRPRRRLLSLATSQTYEINSQQCLCLSWIQSEDDDYRMHDAELATQKLVKEIKHIRKHWLNEEVAVFTFLINEQLCEQESSVELFKTIQSMQLRDHDDQVSYASAGLAYRASKENQLYVPTLCITPLEETEKKAQSFIHADEETSALLNSIGDDDQANFILLKAYLGSRAMSDSVGINGEHTRVRDIIEAQYSRARTNNHWLSARLCFSALGKIHPDLGDSVTGMSAQHMSVIVGHDKKNQIIIQSDSPYDVIAERLRAEGAGPLELCLLQEVLGIIGAQQRTNPEYYSGLRSVHLHNLLRLCSKNNKGSWSQDIVDELGAISPNELLNRVEAIFESQHSNFLQGLRSDLNRSTLASNAGVAQLEHAVDTDWFQWRVDRGLMLKMDREFLERIWKSLANAESLNFGDFGSHNTTINCEMVRSSMTSGEEIFAQLVDDTIRHIHPAYLKASLIEVLYSYILYTEENTTARFTHLNLEDILEQASHEFYSQNELPVANRHIDIFLQQPPEVLQQYISATLSTHDCEEGSVGA